MIWKAVNFIQIKFKISNKISQQMGLASISTRDLAAKKIKPVDTFVRVLENFIVIHCYGFFMQIGAFFFKLF